MNITITSELEAFVEKMLKTGLYHSISEVVQEGLRLLKERDELKDLRLIELKQEIQNGYDSACGDVGKWDLEQFKTKLRAQAAAE